MKGLLTNGQKPKGFYVVGFTETDGTPLGSYGPYDYQFIKDFLYERCQEHVDRLQANHALAITNENPGVPYILSDVREDEFGEEYIAWQMELTFNYRF